MIFNHINRFKKLDRKHLLKYTNDKINTIYMILWQLNILIC